LEIGGKRGRKGREDVEMDGKGREAKVEEGDRAGKL